MNAAVQQQLTNLLRANSMTPDTLDGSTLTQLFLSQMRISLYGGVASIPMFPTFLPPFGTLTENKPIAVAELDDQEIRVSLVTFSHGEAHFSDQDRFPIPGREYPAPWEDLIYAIGELTQPLLDRAQGLALCLPFSVVYDGKGDGTISRFPGSMTIHGFSEKPVLASLREELQSRGCPIPPMTLINESDAVLLAAGVQNPGQGRYLGVTWGSSIDVGFVAPGSIVLRWPGIPGDLTLFTGGFSQAQCVPFGLVDYSKDRDCYAPGLDLYLKMVSTDYLGEIFRLVMIKAAERKLLSFGCSRDILSYPTGPGDGAAIHGRSPGRRDPGSFLPGARGPRGGPGCCSGRPGTSSPSGLRESGRCHPIHWRRTGRQRAGLFVPPGKRLLCASPPGHL